MFLILTGRYDGLRERMSSCSLIGLGQMWDREFVS